jgi:hypothetical protein
MHAQVNAHNGTLASASSVCPIRRVVYDLYIGAGYSVII